jgi:quinoprotein relay system zinc metallohydrolase 2
MAKVADGVYAHRGELADANPQNRGDIANIGFVIGTDCVAVIDTGGTYAIGAALLVSIRKLSQKPICYVINTHVHPDHVFGNAAFASEQPRFVGHARLAAAMAARSDSYLASLTEQVGSGPAQGSLLVPPTVSVPVDTDMSLDLGGRSLVMHAWPTAHTDSDLSVVDSRTGTLWTGDLLFVERIPVIDGSLRGWLGAMAVLADMSPRHVVPGHGPIDAPWQTSVANQSRYLNVIASDVRSALKTDRTLQQTVDRAGLSERSRWRLFEDYNRRNVTASYTELEWEN